MAKEIELKFLVRPGWDKHFTFDQMALSAVFYIQQGYIARTVNTVRVRLVNNKFAYLTIKGSRVGLTCDEYEYEIPYSDGVELFNMCETVTLSKVRWVITDSHNQRWEIDEFEGINTGLIMAELEIPSEDCPVVIPEWAIVDVSTDYRYTNAYISTHTVPTLSEPPIAPMSGDN